MKPSPAYQRVEHGRACQDMQVLQDLRGRFLQLETDIREMSEKANTNEACDGLGQLAEDLNVFRTDYVNEGGLGCTIADIEYEYGISRDGWTAPEAAE